MNEVLKKIGAIGIVPVVKIDDAKDAVPLAKALCDGGLPLSLIHISNSTKKNLEMRAEAEAGACEGKLMIAKRAKELGYDAIHDTVHEMAKDEARHGAGFNGLLKRYF